MLKWSILQLALLLQNGCPLFGQRVNNSRGLQGQTGQGANTGGANTCFSLQCLSGHCPDGTVAPMQCVMLQLQGTPNRAVCKYCGQISASGGTTKTVCQYDVPQCKQQSNNDKSALEDFPGGPVGFFLLAGVLFACVCGAGVFIAMCSWGKRRDLGRSLEEERAGEHWAPPGSDDIEKAGSARSPRHSARGSPRDYDVHHTEFHEHAEDDQIVWSRIQQHTDNHQSSLPARSPRVSVGTKGNSPKGNSPRGLRHSAVGRTSSKSPNGSPRSSERGDNEWDAQAIREQRLAKHAPKSNEPHHHHHHHAKHQAEDEAPRVSREAVTNLMDKDTLDNRVCPVQTQQSKAQTPPRSPRSSHGRKSNSSPDGSVEKNSRENSPRARRKSKDGSPRGRSPEGSPRRKSKDGSPRGEIPEKCPRREDDASGDGSAGDRPRRNSGEKSPRSRRKSKDGSPRGESPEKSPRKEGHGHHHGHHHSH